MTNKVNTNVQDWKQFHADNLAKIDPFKRELAVQFLRGFFDKDKNTVNQIRAAALKDPQTWWSWYHLTWGMAVRNLLRKNGYGELGLGVENLDDHYIGLIEEALL